MARKGENIYKRKDGRYEGRYIKGRRADGRAKYGYVYGYKYQEVKARLVVMKAGCQGDRRQKEPYAGSLWDWVAYWLNTLRKPYIKESTYAGYRNKLENHVLPLLGEKRLDRVGAGDIQMVVDQMGHKGMSGGSIQVVFQVINSALQEAADKHLLFYNPCSEVVLPRRGRKRKKALSVLQQKALEEEAAKEKGCSPVILGSHTGMRIGEISALKWEDVDFKNGCIHVRQTMQRVPDYEGGTRKTRVITGTPKSYISNRVVPLSPVLSAYLGKCAREADSEYVISSKGHHAEPRVIQYRFKKIAKRAGLGGVNFHCMRHTFATRCLEKGVDVATLSALLGHASAKMTLDTYADSLYEQRQAAMKAMDELFERKGGRGRLLAV